MNFENDATITNTGNITALPSPDRDPRLGEPQSHCTCRRGDRRSGQPDRSVHTPAGSPRRSSETTSPTPPADPLGQHRRRHRRRVLEQLPDLLLERLEARHHRRPASTPADPPRRSPSRPCSSRSPVPGDLRLRHSLAHIQPADQCPVFQSDHFPIVGRCSLFERHICSVFNRHRQSRKPGSGTDCPTVLGPLTDAQQPGPDVAFGAARVHPPCPRAVTVTRPAAEPPTSGGSLPVWGADEP